MYVEVIRVHVFQMRSPLDAPTLAFCRQANKLYAAEFGVQPRAMDLIRVSSRAGTALEAAHACSSRTWCAAEP